MDLKYMMLKNKYRFILSKKPVLYDANNFKLYQKQISLLTKELFLYNVQLKQLVREKPKLSAKNELLNIAAICSENESLSSIIRSSRSLPAKRLSALTKKSQSFFEKWNDLIIFYFLLISNNNYSAIYSYLSIEKTAVNNFDNKNSTGLSTDNTDQHNNDLSVGIILNVSKKGFYILNPYGDVGFIISKEKKGIGELCQGKSKTQKFQFSFLLKLVLPCIIVAFIIGIYLYNSDRRVVIIDAGFSIKLDMNRWNKITDWTALNNSAVKIGETSDLNNKSADTAIKALLNYAKANKLIDDTTIVTIYIYSNKDISSSLKNTYRYLNDNKITFVVNNNGNEVKDRVSEGK